MTFYAQPGRDGRRTTDPLKDLAINPQALPGWQLVRLVSANDDATSKAIRNNGVNFGHYNRGHFQIIPLATNDLNSPSAGTANPSVELMTWCPILGKFISMNAKVEYTGLGAGVPYEFEFVSDGRVLMPAITGTAGGDEVIAVYAAGYGFGKAI
jgi:hypothetical protein